MNGWNNPTWMLLRATSDFTSLRLLPWKSSSSCVSAGTLETSVLSMTGAP